MSTFETRDPGHKGRTNPMKDKLYKKMEAKCLIKK